MFQLTTEWIPSVWHPENYPNAWSRANFSQYFANSAIVSIAVMLGMTDVGAAVGQEPLALGPLALQGLAIWTLTLVVFAVALVVAQLVTTRRGATGIAGVIVLALFMVNAGARSGVGVGAIRWLSPFYLYERSTPLLRGGSLDVPATALDDAHGLVRACRPCRYRLCSS